MAEKLVAIAAGGTAGHVNPALALAEELSARGLEVLFFGQPQKLEGRLVPEAGFELSPLRVSGLDRSRPWTAVSALLRLARARRVVDEVFRDRPRPAAAVGFGAYVEVPLLGWCHDHGVPYAIHEQNSVVGLANRMMAAHARAICVAYPQAAEALVELAGPTTEVVETGNPVRASIVAGDGARARERHGIPPTAQLLVVFGGSLGARSINETMASIASRLLAHHPSLHVIHGTGREGFEAAEAALSLDGSMASRWHLEPYLDDMGDVLAAADLAVCRAGASSVAELAAAHVPAVLVPYPHATADHQTTNARWLADAGCAIVVPDDELQTPGFAETLDGLLGDGSRLEAMAASAAALGGERAAARLADVVCSLARG